MAANPICLTAYALPWRRLTLKLTAGQEEDGRTQNRPAPPVFLTVNCPTLYPPMRHSSIRNVSDTAGKNNGAHSTYKIRWNKTQNVTPQQNYYKSL